MTSDEPSRAVTTTPSFGPRASDLGQVFAPPLAVPPTLPHIGIGGFDHEHESISDE